MATSFLPSPPVDIEALLDSRSKELTTIAEAAAKGEHGKVIDAAGGLVVSLATGHPALGALVPFARAAIAKAFGNATDAMLRRELAVLEQEEQRRAFLHDIGMVIATLMAQAQIELVRAQHGIADKLRDELISSLGGMLTGTFEQFRNDFVAHAGDTSSFDAVFETQEVRAGGLGIRLRPETTKRILVRFQLVSGPGSVGVEL